MKLQYVAIRCSLNNKQESPKRITKTKDLLYDATEKNNLEDSLRIIFPFVGAWREIVGTYIGFTLEDPGRLARVGRYTNILGSSDPDGDGRGFWYEDPQSGDPYFKFPEIFGLPAALRAAGVKSFFEAPVAQLSQGTSWIPGIGPLAQIPASFIFRNKKMGKKNFWSKKSGKKFCIVGKNLLTWLLWCIMRIKFLKLHFGVKKCALYTAFYGKRKVWSLISLCEPYRPIKDDTLG